MRLFTLLTYFIASGVNKSCRRRKNESWPSLLIVIFWAPVLHHSVTWPANTLETVHGLAAFFFFLFNRDNIKFECYLQTQSKCTALQLKSGNLRTPTVAMDHQKHGLAGFLTHWIQFKEENGFKWVEGLWPWKTVPSWKWTLMWSEQKGGDKHSQKHESHSHTWWLPWW